MKRMGFTLIELLVVISTIALLMAMLVPALGPSKNQARAILCGSNIKQLAFALSMYASDNETFPHALDETPLRPPAGGYPGNPMYDRMGWWWFNYTTDYSRTSPGKPSIILCPSRKIGDGMLKTNVLCGNYGVNRSICKSSSGWSDHLEFTGRPLRISDISRAGETLLVVDSGYSMITWWHAADVPPEPFDSAIVEDTAYIPGLEINKDRILWAGQEQDAIDGRHPNKTVNIGFVDGHIDRVEAEHLAVEKTADGYANKNPLWEPQ